MPAKFCAFLFMAIIAISVLFSGNSIWAEDKTDCTTQHVIPESLLENFETALTLSEVPLLKVIARETEKNVAMYLFGSPDVGIYFMQRNLSIIATLKDHESTFIPEKARIWDEVLTYARLGNSFKKAENGGEADTAYSQAWSAYQQTGNKRLSSLEDLLEFVTRLDKSNLKYIRTKDEESSAPLTMFSKKPTPQESDDK